MLPLVIYNNSTLFMQFMQYLSLLSNSGTLADMLAMLSMVLRQSHEQQLVHLYIITRLIYSTNALIKH